MSNQDRLDSIIWGMLTRFRFDVLHGDQPFGQMRADYNRKFQALIDKSNIALLEGLLKGRQDFRSDFYEGTKLVKGVIEAVPAYVIEEQLNQLRANTPEEK